MKLTNVMIAAAAFAIPAAAGAQQAAPAQPATPPVAQAPDQPTQPAGQTAAPGQTAPAATAPATGAAANAATAAATQADLKAGTPVFDQNGGSVGKVESASAEGAVVATGKVRVRIPVASFGKNDRGLVIALTKTELEAQAAKTGHS